MYENQKKATEKEFCPFTQLINFLSKKWNLIIIKSISDGCKSYSEIERNIIWANPRIISNRLKDLQWANIIEKKNISQTPSRSIYCLTEKGNTLCKHIDALSDWAKKNIDKAKCEKN